MFKKDATEEERAQHHAMREAFYLKNPAFLNCVRRTVDHDSTSFIKVTRFNLAELKATIDDMREVLKEERREGTSPSTGDTPELTSCCTSSESSGITTPSDLAMLDGSSISSRSSLATSADGPRASVPLEVPFIEIPRFESTASISTATFQALWKTGQPILIGGMLERLKIRWTPDYFIQNHHSTVVRVLDCQSDKDPGQISVEYFFSMFGQYEQREADRILKLRDWPPSADFKTVFPLLYEDFAQAVPFPDYVRRDGVLNMSSHFPVDVLAPDLGRCLIDWLATGLIPLKDRKCTMHSLPTLVLAVKVPHGYIWTLPMLSTL